MAASEMHHTSPLSTITQNSRDRQAREQEFHGDIKFCILESFPFQHAKR